MEARLLIALFLLNFCTAARAGLCVPLSQCHLSVDRLLSTDDSSNEGSLLESCKLEDNSQGVLCQSRAQPNVATRFLSPTQQTDDSAVVFPDLQGRIPPSSPEVTKPLTHRLDSDERFLVIASKQEKEDALAKVHDQFGSVSIRFKRPNSRGQPKANTPEGLQQRFGKIQEPGVEDIGQRSLETTQVLQELLKNNGLVLDSEPINETSSDEIIGEILESRFGPVEHIAPDQGGAIIFDDSAINNRSPGCILPPPTVCPSNQAAKYRTFTGECNNLVKPSKGSASTSFIRLFPNGYDDGIWAVRTRSVVAGRTLPSPREVSASVITTSPRHDRSRTLSVMQFGQFINHDFVSTPTMPLRVSSCCENGGRFPQQDKDPRCIPIRIPANDHFYSKFRITCMNQVRSLTADPDTCEAGPRNQLNQVSQYLDASNVYGSSEERARSLRTFAGDGKLKASLGNLLPVTNGRFQSGEGRFSENPGLTFMHTVWTREHNRVASVLKRQHPDWNEEKLFQESRRLVIAQYQHVIYNEFVPAILGTKFAEEHALLGNLENNARHFQFKYSPSFDPRVTAEFSTAAFRFGHAMVNDAFIFRSETGRVLGTLSMENSFFQDNLLKQQGFVTNMARTLIQQPPRTVDTTFSPAIHESLFSGQGQAGLDIVSLNINRGRDHGLPPYVTALQNCMNREIPNLSWRSLKEFMDAETIQRLRRVYSDVRDIDLFIGGISERAAPGALVGPTFQCVIGEQFFNGRYGDRFFYDNKKQPHSFNEDQLRQIRQSSWARILCDNVPELRFVQPLGLFSSSLDINPEQSCKSRAIGSVDLSFF